MSWKRPSKFKKHYLKLKKQFLVPFPCLAATLKKSRKKPCILYLIVTHELNERSFTLTMIIDLAYDCSYILYNSDISQQLYFWDQNNILITYRCIDDIILLCTNLSEIYQKLCLCNYWILFILTQSSGMSLLYTLKTRYIKSYVFIIIELSLSLHNHPYTIIQNVTVMHTQTAL